MDDVQAVAWLHRRAGWGLHPDALRSIADDGVDAAIDQLVPSADGVIVDPWEGLNLDPEEEGRQEAVIGWVRHLFETPQPFIDRRAWMLHGWLVSSLAGVPLPVAMVDQIRLFLFTGGSSFAQLLRDVTTDRAMLVYLDGYLSTGDDPNENYGRELLELFGLGVGNYTEDDVKTAAAALTGWVVNRESSTARFIGRRHDDTPRTLLGTAGVHDVDSVIDAVVDHPAHPHFVAHKVTSHYLGDPDDDALDGVVEALADVYVQNDRQLDPVIEAALRLGLDGASSPLVAAPIPWLVSAVRALGISTPRALRAAAGRVRELGQVPLLPPNVAGWPDGAAWFTTSSLIARTNIAARLADETAPNEPIVVALDDGDLDRAAELLGLAEPFSPSTDAAVRSASDRSARLALTLVSPEVLLT